jgi:hypothetical protein
MQRSGTIDPDAGDAHEQIAQLEALIEELSERIERCRKFILMSKLAIIAGAILLAAILFEAIRFDPVALIGAITAVIGGIVLFGSNTSTLQQAIAALRSAEAERAELIGQMKLRLVEQAALTTTLH